MIIQTSRICRKGGVRYLACHLLDKSSENDLIEILSGDRYSLFDADALARVKRCKYSVRHFSISPQLEMTPQQLTEFFRSIDSEFSIGADRPRLVVRHVKKGKSHFHIAVAEVDPVTLRVLDCRNDYTRLENLARHYEQHHNETVQSDRAERRQRKVEGLSAIARKRAERTVAAFDRTKLKKALGAGHQSFDRELARQGLHIAKGDKGPILVDSEGTFVAAANRVAGVRRNEFINFMKGLSHDGNDFRVPDADCSGVQHQKATAAPVLAGGPRRARPANPAYGAAHGDLGRAAQASSGFEDPYRKGRPYCASIGSRLQSERLFIGYLGKFDLDDLLRRAEQLAAWIRTIFEPQVDRLTRQIQDRKQIGKAIVPANAETHPITAYTYQGRMKL
ncbi:MAG: relaxase/mobilization nuclease domain-containing protein [Hoeflea sp.]|uniref:relaxase/mobilization nuclease domain-containing protein n=1 Tax=Hoeflea sp. TaxID=1940281 RepID=UPI002730E27F|nr:relaxase/mobilization nuclease domain-containing protein [Hoeflea sp.]MDP2121280.1 relaxase/mobilization nuclease domain-containing protein [Hoeflea sp.]